jgi:hypothetical protein
MEGKGVCGEMVMGWEGVGRAGLFATSVRKHLAALVIVIVSRRRRIPISGFEGRLGWAWKLTRWAWTGLDGLG